MVPPIDGARRSQKTFGPKTQENQIGIRPAYFSYKEIVYALQYLYVKLFHQKIRIMWIIRSILNLFLAGHPFYNNAVRPGVNTPLGLIISVLSLAKEKEGKNERMGLSA